MRGRHRYILGMGITGMYMLLFFSSCSEDYLAKSTWKWEDAQWVYGDKKTMTMTATDTTTVYKLDLQVNHEETYPYSNLYVRTLTKYPSGKEVVSVTSLELVDDQGYWAGDLGENCCKLKLPLQSRFTFPEIGEYAWTIEPYMRLDTVKGVNALKVICSPVTE